MPVSHASFNKKIAPAHATPMDKKQPEHYVVENALPNPDDKLQEFVSDMVIEEKPTPVKTTTKTNKILEDLIFAGRSVETVEAAGHQFELSTLTNKEHKEMLKRLFEIDPEANILTIRTLSLAAGLRKIDGLDLSEFVLDEEFTTLLDKKIYLVEHLQIAITEKLWLNYEKMLEQSKQLVTTEQIKK